MRKKIIFLVGPTAVGKSDIAIELAKRLNAEIISCDSMQVYKGMDIGTQKAPLELRKKVRHHMIDILTPDKEFSAADFRKRALRIIRNLHDKNKIPLFVGGTGLYVKALIDGLFPSPAKNEALRRRLYRRKGLYEKLKRIDPRTAENIHPNDKKKIVRALEVYYTTKKTMSELKSRTRPLSDEFDIKIFGLNKPRQKLYEGINERVDRMFEQGLLDEAERLSKKKIGLTASQAIGYKEIFDYLRDKISLDSARELIKRNTRRYAKRQLSWFRADKRVKWIEVGEGEALGKIVKRISSKMSLRAKRSNPIFEIASG